MDNAISIIKKQMHRILDVRFDLKNHHYSCGLSTATIEYSCLSVCVGACVCVCVCVCLSVCVNNGSIHLKLEHIVAYGNSSDEFDIGHCTIKLL